MNTFYKNKDFDVKKLSYLALAFVGDAVFDLIIREKIAIENLNFSVKEMHELKIKQACCSFQAKMAKNITSFLTENELKFYKMARNSKINQIPKNVCSSDYHQATAFEALLGYFYLSNNTKRIKELFLL